jgi:CheY-like chemotaxis protein
MTEAAKRRVIVVDDEVVIANTLAIILNHAGFEAIARFSGEEAVPELEHFKPDLLICDVIMPGMSGIEAAIITRSKLPKCKILLLSGQAATSALLNRARSEGTNSTYSPSRFIRRTFWRSCADRSMGVLSV